MKYEQEIIAREGELSIEEMLQVIQTSSLGYRMVFNLFVIVNL
ncbi:MAG: hypothetical protein ACUVQP_01285 [Bacteroidales bacterium]